jgi:HSP20 family protein
MALSPMGRFWSRDPFAEMRRVQSEMNRLFEGMPLDAAGEFPQINVWSDAEGVVVTALLPGVGSDNINITVQEDTLTLKGERALTDAEAATWHRRERPAGSFARTVVLPFRVDADATEAMYDQGVLAIRLKRPTEDQPRQIKISKS